MQSFYIHWPFCPYRCHFCPFVAYLKNDSFLKPYHDALCKELLMYGDSCNQRPQLETIYFGGGTPSTYPDDLLLDTFGILEKVSNFNEKTEITFEVNPGTATAKQLALWKDMGINRLSIGVQSLNEQVLKNVNRLQTNEDVCTVLELAKDRFENVSVDFILGLPGVTDDEWKEQLRKVVQWPIKHVSVYFLMVHEFTPLYYRVQKKSVQLPSDSRLADLYCWTVDFLQDHGIEQYEVSSFAKPGFQSRHNKAYWDRKPYKGFGVGAWSFDENKRYRNKKNLMLYMKGIGKGEDLIEFSETLTDDQAALEHFMLGFRQVKGVSRDFYFTHIPSQKHMEAHKLISDLCSRELLKEENGRLKLTVRGLAVEQEIITQLSL
ncbi:MAG: radical SAM family heme chaperone HemW [Candidatus Dependentiae bacterium]